MIVLAWTGSILVRRWNPVVLGRSRCRRGSHLWRLGSKVTTPSIHSLNVDAIDWSVTAGPWRVDDLEHF